MSCTTPWRVVALLAWAAASAWAGVAAAERSHRATLSLDGTWEVADSVAPDAMPARFDHKVSVPGLTHSARPAFADVDQYQTKQLLSNLVQQGLYAKADYDKLGDVRGISHQARNYFWYRTTFEAPARTAVALLKVSKAQFGTVAYLNGVRIGEHDSCFTSVVFDVSRAIRWGGPNTLVIRIGAHPGVLPRSVSGGTDFEKNRWTPGIYDDVALLTMDNPVVASVQVAPRLATAEHPTASILVQTELHNYSDRAIETLLAQDVFEKASGRPGAAAQSVQVTLSPGADKVVTQSVAVPQAHLWSLEDPFLYQVRTRTAGDEVVTRFGMREFRFDTATQRAYLNGRPYFMRGSNIALHRFFEDPKSGGLPWDDAWVHRLLVDIPKSLHWNAFRFTIGPVPDRWLEIADESGLLIQNEYSVWTGSPLWTTWKSSYDPDELVGEYKAWMRDNWNHPSVVIWDASNESLLPDLARKVVPAVRGLDLSNRPWEDSYNDPIGPDDPVEDHQYLLESTSGGFDAGAEGRPFALRDLEGMEGPGPNPFLKTGHAMILNEYGWLWLNRDGSPTLLTNKLFPKLLGAADSTEARRELAASILGGETEFWRAYRRYAGVMHFVYLTSSDPKGFTSDNFIDVRTLTLEPHFASAIEQAFRPLGVYLNYWHDAAGAGTTQDYTVYMVNDEARPRAGRLRLAFVDASGKVEAERDTPFALEPLGAQGYTTTLAAPASPGRYTLQATAEPADDPAHPTVSRRTVTLGPAGTAK